MNRLKRLLPVNFVDGVAFGVWLTTPPFVGLLVHKHLYPMSALLSFAWIWSAWMRLKD